MCRARDGFGDRITLARKWHWIHEDEAVGPAKRADLFGHRHPLGNCGMGNSAKNRQPWHGGNDQEDAGPSRSGRSEQSISQPVLYGCCGYYGTADQFRLSDHVAGLVDATCCQVWLGREDRSSVATSRRRL